MAKPESQPGIHPLWQEYISLGNSNNQISSGLQELLRLTTHREREIGLMYNKFPNPEEVSKRDERDLKEILDFEMRHPIGIRGRRFDFITDEYRQLVIEQELRSRFSSEK